MNRCLALALQGAGCVAPNPMVGSVLVYNDTIIGEGYHRQYGQAHAEVNCINSVSEENKHLIPDSTIYVSLEPCAHFGKTPPCADLIIKNGIKNVVIGCRDPFGQVNGKGIEKLLKAGITVTTGILEQECKDLNKRFFTFHQKKRPYIVLKWAQTADNFIANNNDNRLLISNEITNRLVHRWRSEEAGILVGTNTALKDNPALTNRFGYPHQPVRILIDKHLRVPTSFNIFNNDAKTIVFNSYKNEEVGNVSYVKLETFSTETILDTCYRLNIQSILVEGGAKTLQSFIDNNLWDEARVITNTTQYIGNGLMVPALLNSQFISYESILSDRISYFVPLHSY